MARKRKNNIVEQLQATENTNIADQTTIFDTLDPETNNESMLESVPDDPKQMDMLNDKISQIQQLMSELNVAKSTISELEAKIKQLQSDNDMLVMKLAEQAAAAVQQKSDIEQHNAASIQTSSPRPKNVYYNQPKYINNGYGTWH